MAGILRNRRADHPPGIRRRSRVAGWVAAIIGIIIIVFVILWLHKPPNPVPPSAVLDLRSVATSGKNNAPPKLPTLPHARLELSVALPSGSGPGPYQAMVARQPGQALVMGTGDAREAGGKAVLNIKMDLAALNSGNYFFGFRQRPQNWKYYPITIK